MERKLETLTLETTWGKGGMQKMRQGGTNVLATKHPMLQEYAHSAVGATRRSRPYTTVHISGGLIGQKLKPQRPCWKSNKRDALLLPQSGGTPQECTVYTCTHIWQAGCNKSKSILRHSDIMSSDDIVSLDSTNGMGVTGACSRESSKAGRKV